MTSNVFTSFMKVFGRSGSRAFCAKKTRDRCQQLWFTPARAGLPCGEIRLLLESVITPKNISVRAFAVHRRYLESNSEEQMRAIIFLGSEVERILRALFERLLWSVLEQIFLALWFHLFICLLACRYARYHQKCTAWKKWLLTFANKRGQRQRILIKSSFPLAPIMVIPVTIRTAASWLLVSQFLECHLRLIDWECNS